MRKDVYIQDLLGVPFKKRGRDMKGMDCFGVVKEVWKRAGVVIPDYGSPDEDDLIPTIVEGERDLFLQLEKPEPWCLVTFFYIPKYVEHFGVVLPNLKQFIHVKRDSKVSIDRLDHLFWKPRIEGYYKWNTSK